MRRFERTHRCVLSLSIAVALLGPAGAVQAQEASGQTADGKAVKTLDKIVVTANRRQQELKDFAGSVTPLTAEQLDKLHAVKMEDYLTRTPGVSFNEMRPGSSNITIRGVGTTIYQDQGQASTGIFINDIPLTEPVFSFSIPDIDTFDVDRVEVLRGPQGTAYGSGTLGGAVNYIARSAAIGVTEGRVQLGVSRTAHSSSPNTEARAMFNLPLGNHAALRAVLVRRADDGWVTNLQTGKRAINDALVQGGRVMLDWELGERSKLSWMSLFQKIESADSSYDVNVDGRYQRRTAQAAPFNTDVTLHNLKFLHEFDAATLSLSAVKKQKTQYTLIDIANPFFMDVVLGSKSGPPAMVQTAQIPGTVFEARLTSAGAADAPFQWSIGAFYDRTREDILVESKAAGAAAAIEATWAGAFGAGIGAKGAPGDVFWVINDKPVGSEKALFGEATWRFADAWKLSLGGRYYRTEVSVVGARRGFFYLFTGSPLDSALVGTQKESGFSPKAVLSYNINDNNMLYALASRGFRYGGPNPNPPGVASDAPALFDSDSLWNYEVGYRTSNASGSWIADITGYQINWSNMQFRKFTPTGLAYQGNIGDARIRGLEASTTWRPSKSFEWSAAVTLTDAQTVDVVSMNPTTQIAAGTRLPGASRVRLATDATYRWATPLAPYVTAAVRHVSKAPAQLDQQNLYTLGGYSALDLRAGLQLNEQLGVSAWISNATNTYGITSSGDAYLGPNTISRTTIRPRTIGMMLDLKF